MIWVASDYTGAEPGGSRDRNPTLPTPPVVGVAQNDKTGCSPISPMR